MRILNILCLSILIALSVSAQNNVGIGTPTPDPSAILELKSNSMGILIPRMTSVERTAIPNPQNGLLVYDTDSSCFFYFISNSGTWGNMCNSGTPSALAWQLTGNSGTTPSSSAIGAAVNNNFIGTIDNNAFVIATDNFEQVRVTGSATGVYNTETDGFVGIGTNAPVDKLHVASINTGISIQDLTPGTGKIWRVSSDSQGRYRVTDATSSQARFEINPMNTGMAALVDNTSTLLAANSPAATLHIDAGTGNTANIKLTNSTGTGFTATDGFDVGITSTGSAFLQQYENQPIVIYTDNIERERVLASGAISVNKTVPNLNIVMSAYGNSYPGALSAPGDTAIAGFSTTNNGVGVYGENNDGTGSGVLGSANTSGASGIQGQNIANLTQPNQIAVGVYGLTTGTAIPGTFSFGVYGITNLMPSTGVVGAGNGQDALVNSAGGGGAFTGDSNGVLGYATVVTGGIGVIGLGNGINTIVLPSTGTGIMGIGTNYGVMGYSSNALNTNGGASSAGNGVLASAGGYFEADNGLGVGVSWAYVGVQDATGTVRKIIGNGTVNTIVKDTKNKLVALSCPEAPENLFQDLGTGRLENGKAHVTLDPIFSKNIIVNEQHSLRAFIQLEENCNGVYITNKDQNGFDVVEMGNGKSNASFTWMVMANRADEVLADGSISRFSVERFPAAPGPENKTTTKALPVPVIHSTKSQ